MTLGLAIASFSSAEAGIPWHENLVTAKSASVVSQRPLLVIFTAAWSEASDRFLQTTLSSPESVGVVCACFEAVRLDVDMNPELARRLGVTNLPTACVIDANEQLLFQFECSDSSADFVAFAARAVQHAATAKQIARPFSVPTAVNPSPSLAGVRDRLFPSDAAQAYSPVSPTMPTTLPAVSVPPPTNVVTYPTTTQPAPTVPSEAEASSARTRPFVALLESTASLLKGDETEEVSEPPPVQVSDPVPQPLNLDRPNVANMTPQPSMTENASMAMEGFCPVTLVEKGAWVAGNSQWGARHKGRVYLFAGPVEQQVFFASPERYAPVLSGDDPVLALDAGRNVPGDRRYGLTYESRTYLFSSPETLNVFSAAPEKYARRVMVAENSSTLSTGTILR